MGSHRRTPPAAARHRRQSPARTGLLGASAALTLGAMAMGTGLVPGPGESFTFDNTGDPQAQEREDRVADTSTSLADRHETTSPSRAYDRPAGPETPQASEPSKTAEPSKKPKPTEEPTPEASETTEEAPPPSSSAPAPAPETSQPAAPPPSSSAPASTPASPSEAPVPKAADAVLQLVNQERAKAGCRPLSHDPALADVAQAFSRDMAERNFFSHTDPDGRSPWDRAEAANVKNMGGENIARGQQTAEAVMQSWMNSEGHRANILNCDFKTLGVGVHTASGGPWWTQAFGY
ncbi:CAP domain-containing protein [Streptomyces sp. ACA25]|uniref:CAP domain-containing protein n=1 Tax=Streptomyces sp. ACA25 TaxID=3022596 RepID=UPI002306DD18|nr:CAP domain-containing protein [Streptomyces sp. ACA25]MDB1089628.1 CAP domain-containing protein [Streptomyces sp. ACA25]